MNNIIKYIVLYVLMVAGTQVSAQEANISDKIFSFFIRINDQKELDSMKAIYAALQKSYPEENYKNFHYIYEMARGNLAVAMIKANDPDDMNMISAIPAGQIRRNYLGNIANYLLKYGKAAAAEDLLKDALAAGPKDSLNYYTYSYNYADLLYQLKKYDEALQWIKPVEAKGGLKSDRQKVLYATLLAENGQYQEPVRLLSGMAKKGMASTEAKAVLKKAWVALGNNADNFDNYLNGLLSEMKLSVANDIKKHEVNYLAPDFKLVGLDGKEVVLSSLKDKVVMLDFWATWCGPCVGAFPAMQKAVNKYENNKDVVFLFINSWETETNAAKRASKVKAFMANTPYQFNVLLDPNSGTKQADYVVISKYGVKGIPAKFIIDKKGNVRYALTGFNGGDDATVEEISIAIDRLLKS